MAIEARPPVPWGKGRASLYILRTTYGADWHERVRIVYTGDDDADEDVMETLSGLACTFRVSKERVASSAANYRLNDPDSVLAMLHWIEGHMSGRLGTAAAMQNPVPLAFVANFLITSCIHIQPDYVDSDEERELTQTNTTATTTSCKRRRRNSRGSSLVQQLQNKAAGIVRPSSLKAALCSRDSQDCVPTIGH